MFGRDRRRDDRAALRRPTIEGLEARQLLSNVPARLVAHHAAHPHAARKIVAHTADASATPANPSDGFDLLDNATAARAQFGVDGSGLAAAVIDTGVDYNDSTLGSGFGAGRKVEDGYDFADASSDPLATASQHGTAVAGILAGSDPAHPGVAPGADVVALRVFGSTDNGDFDKVADALQWVVDNHAKDNITVVNLSMSDGNNYSIDWFSKDGGIGQRISGLVQQLDALNIPVVVAAGNSNPGSQGTGFPSIIAGTIGVTSTNGASMLASDAQRLGPIGGASATALAAPGVGLTAPVDNNNYATVDGTSFAAPQVSGSIILLQGIYQSRFGSLPTVSMVEGWLKAGSSVLYDTSTGITIGRLDILKAAQQIPAAPAPTAPTVVTSPTPAPSAPTPTTTPVVTTPTPTPTPTPVVSTPVVTTPVVTTTPPSQIISNAPTTTDAPTTPAVVAPTKTTTPPVVATPVVTTPVVTTQPTTATPPATSTTQTTTTTTNADQATQTEVIAAPLPPTAATPKTELLVNGQSVGSVVSGSSDDPFAEFAGLFAVDATFSRVQVWNSTGSVSIPGSAAPSGTIHVALAHSPRHRAPSGLLARRHSKASRA